MVEFYYFQRWFRAAERDATPAPPGPLIDPTRPGCDEAPPLSVQTSNLDEFGNVRFTPLSETATNAPETRVTKVKVSRPKQGKIMTYGKAKPVDDPVVIKRREEIRAMRVLQMAKARAARKAKAG